MLCLSLMPVLTWASTPDSDVTKRLEKAYKLHALEFDKKVIAQTKKWADGYGILHPDWIENLHGKSIDAQGNVILPQYDYSRVQLYSKNYYVLTVNDRKGVVTRDGRQLTHFVYSDFDFSLAPQGLFLAWSDASGTKTDIYTVQGKLVRTMEGCMDLHVAYNAETNLITIEYTDGKGEMHFMQCYPDGTSAETEGGEHPVLPVRSKDSVMAEDIHDFMFNTWGRYGMVPLAGNENMPRMPKSFYEDLLFDLEYFADFEWQQLQCTASLVHMMFYNSYLSCCYNLGMYDRVLSILHGSGLPFLPLPYVFDTESRQVVLDEAFDAYKSMGQMLDKDLAALNNMYAQSVVGLQTAEAKAEEKAERKKRNSEALGVALGIGVAGAADILMERVAASSHSSSPAKTTSVSKSNTSTSSATSGSEEPVFENVEEHEKCTVCDGKGHCKYCDGKGTKVYSAKRGTEVCASCNGSPKCKACDGRGYKIRYTTKKK